MPQLQLPLFADGLTSINENLAFQPEDGQIVYFHGMMPVFQHGEKDDLMPDPQAKTLTVRLHHLTQAAHDTSACVTRAAS